MQRFIQFGRWNSASSYDAHKVDAMGRHSFVRFLWRYPIFLLAFGPPIFRTQHIDATKGIVDVWSLFQVGFLFVIAARAAKRLVTADSILLTKQSRYIIKMVFILGLFYLASSIYSPSRLVSAAYSILYLASWVCALEFLSDIYRNSPDWMRVVSYLRFIAILLLIPDLILLVVDPSLVMFYEPGVGIRFGGLIGPVPLECPVIAIVSAYFFLHSLESKGRSIALFFLGFAGAMSTHARGCEIALMLSLSLLVVRWAFGSKRSLSIVIPGFVLLILLSGVAFGAYGGKHIWSAFNRGENVAAIETASGRTQMWHFVLQYSLTHPQGMGYVAGFRVLFRDYFTLGLLLDPTRIGNAHNAYVQVLADAGWLALAIYLIIVINLLRLAWRFSNRRLCLRYAVNGTYRNAIECMLYIFIYEAIGGISAADGVVPLRVSFYWYIISVAVILGISTSMIVDYRSR